MTWQRVALDRLRRVSYIGAGVLAVACRPRVDHLVPANLAPADRAAATAWAAATAPRTPTAVQFRWVYGDERVRYTGRGTARMAPPDSLRFDYRGTLGIGVGAAVVLGDRVAWADPRASFESLVPAVPLLWVAFGTVPPPGRDAVVFGGGQAPRTIWRYVQGRDTLDFVATEGAPRRLEAEWRQAGAVRARTVTEYDEHAMPASARIEFPEAAARFEITVVARDTLAVIAPVLWRRR